MLYFISRSEAYARRKAEGYKQHPRKREVWIIYEGWVKVWSLDPALG